jgi:hypothetical protein
MRLPVGGRIVKSFVFVRFANTDSRPACQLMKARLVGFKEYSYRC